jgi:Fe-Mn family superoxide dismutase
MAIKLPSLPYAKDALEPHVSAKTFSYHYDRHHRAYVDKLNGLIDGTDYADLALEQIIDKSRAKGDGGVFNNAAQVWNHTFLWESMSPKGGQQPGGPLKKLIEKSFGDLDTFKDKFREAAMTQFGSGWAWLVLDGGKVRIVATGNAETPVATPLIPLLTLDVWEHAYYLDYQNDRKGYVDAFLDNLINWDFAAANLDKQGVTRAA